MVLGKSGEDSYGSIEEFLNSKPDIYKFCKYLFDWEPFDYQREPLADNSDKLILVFGRQSGKSTIVALKGLYKAMTQKENTVLIVSPTQRQSSNLFRRMKRFLKYMTIKHPNFMKEDNWGNLSIPFIERETQTCLEFKNNSEVISLPAGEDGSNLLGYTAHLIIVDECARVNDEVFVSLRPMFATTWTNSQFILISTPRGVKNYFYEAYRPGPPLSNMGFKIYTASSSKSPLVDDAFLKRESESMTQNEFMQEYEAAFIDESDTFFTLQEINSVMSTEVDYKTEADRKYEYYLGYDPATVGEDEAVGIILERRPDYLVNRGAKEFAVAQIISKKKCSINEQIGLIKNLHNKWNFKRICIDVTGFGQAFPENLKKLPIEGITFTVNTIEDLYNNGKKFFESASFIMPQSQTMKNQLNELKYEYRRGSGRLNVFNPRKTGKTDYPTALMLALWATKKTVHQILVGFARSLG